MIRRIAFLLARLFISLVFLIGSVNKILNWHETEKSVIDVLCDWQANVGVSENSTDCFGPLIMWAPVLLIVATLFELVGGLLILLGIREKLGAVLLILFLIPTTILMHQFWFVDGSMRELQMVNFFKNLAILGGLILFVLRESPKTFPSIKIG